MNLFAPRWITMVRSGQNLLDGYLTGRKLHKAAKVLSDARIRREREAIRAKARQLCIESNQPIPRALRG